jgi:hypothetical protein
MHFQARAPKDSSSHLEDDKMISDFSVHSGRLLGRQDEKHQHDVRIQADITIKVLRVFSANMGLIGG